MGKMRFFTTCVALGVVCTLAQNDSSNATMNETSTAAADDSNVTSTQAAQSSNATVTGSSSGNATETSTAAAGNVTTTVSTTAAAAGNTTTTTTTTTAASGDTTTTTAASGDATTTTAASGDATTTPAASGDATTTPAASGDATTTVAESSNNGTTAAAEEKSEVVITQALDMPVAQEVLDDANLLGEVYGAVGTGVATGICEKMYPSDTTAQNACSSLDKVSGTTNEFQNTAKNHKVTCTHSTAGRRRGSAEQRLLADVAVTFTAESKLEVATAVADAGKVSWDNTLADDTAVAALKTKIATTTQSKLAESNNAKISALSTVNITVAAPSEASVAVVTSAPATATSGAVMVATAGASMLVAALLF